MDDLTETGAHPQKRGRRTVWLVLGGGLLLVLLVGAAFVGGKLLARQPQRPGGRLPVTSERPEGFPDEEPDVAGVFTRRDGNSLFLSTGGGMKVEPGGGVITMDDSGPEIEVVVTHKTEIYKESMEFQEDTVRKIVQPGSLENLESIGQGNCSVRVWGEKRGDRITARVLVYQEALPYTVGP
ncbi:MAG TPA: hypothetical protein G4N97_11110 [Thermoflexia bacterium]|nr:hypothetical protein [Thermoflexia bacterium]